MKKIKYIIGEGYAYMEEDNDSEYPHFAEMTTDYSMTEEEIFSDLCDLFFGTDIQEGIWFDVPNYTKSDCFFIRK